jgi:hypothetical protein
MKKAFLGLVFAAVAASAAASAAERMQAFTGTGIITDTMCGAKHTMGISPDDKCVRECVRMDPKKWKYALLVGSDLYVLSDQQTPEKFAARKVKVTGALFEKTKILRADKIEAVR